MPIVIGDRERMYRLGHELRRRGLWVAPVTIQLFRKIESVSVPVSRRNIPARIWTKRSIFSRTLSFRRHFVAAKTELPDDVSAG